MSANVRLGILISYFILSDTFFTNENNPCQLRDFIKTGKKGRTDSQAEGGGHMSYSDEKGAWDLNFH